MTEMAEYTIGFAGCGAMGLPMASNLHAAGYKVVGFDKKNPEEFQGTSISFEWDANDFAAQCDLLFSIVRDWPQTLALCFEEQAIFNQANYPKIFVVSSTLSPRQIMLLRDLLPKDVTLIDAPMSGAPYRAENAELTFMVGGDQEMVNEMDPLFKAMGKQVYYLGGLSTGMTCKVLNNMLAATNVVAVRRMRACANALGLAPEKFQEIVSVSSGSNWFGDNFDEINWAEEHYSKNNTIGILEKDMQSMLDAVQDFPELTESGFEKAVIEALQKL